MEYTVSLMRQVLQKYERQGRVTKDLLSPILASDEELADYFKEIPKLNEKIRSLKQSGKDKYALEEARMERTDLKKKYSECIDRFVQLSLDKLHDKDFQLDLKKVVCRGKDAFQVEPTLENMLFMGMLNRNLRSCYKVQPANRIPILRVLKSLLEENHGMIILRLDIKSFFESISFDDMLTKFTDDGILCPESFKLLRQINEAYKKLTDANVGIPRGIPCSSFLAEIYMRDIDSRIKSMPGVYYYQRYVDDMIILICPENVHVCPKQYFKRISNMVSKYVIGLISVPYNAAIIAHEKMSAFAYISILEAVGKLAIAFLIMISPMDRLIFYAILMCVVGLIIRFTYGHYCKKHFAECTYHFHWDKEILMKMFGFAGWNFIGAASAVLGGKRLNMVYD